MKNKNRIISCVKNLLSNCLNANDGENLVVVADFPNASIAGLIAATAKEFKLKVSVMLMEKMAKLAENPPEPISYAIQKADIVIFTTVYSLSNSIARINANKAGARIISIPGCSEKLFGRESMDVDFLSLEPLVKKIGKIISVKGIARLTTEQGTNLSMRLIGRKSIDQTCICHEKGSWSPFPLVETAVGPFKYGVNGTLLIDGVIVPYGKIKNPLKVLFRKGRIVDIFGGSDAEKFKSYLQRQDDPNIYQCVELGLGLNPKSKMGDGFFSEDESEYGTVHIGIGQGFTFGLKVRAKTHIDLVIKNPKMEINGRLILSDRKFDV
ncbi:MAG: aminopeptidase [Actinobacteria bacterium]|nr:aminopeptidase [Actinomycetota bacterium]